jgi:phosphate transport system ATP-binding protein
VYLIGDRRRTGGQLLDEPCSALDPVASRWVEELVVVLKKNYTFILVIHNMR